MKAATCPSCSGCGLLVDGDGVLVAGKVYHDSCVLCSECKRHILGPVTTVGQPVRLLCGQCAARVEDTAGQAGRHCKQCKLPILGDCLQAQGEFYHKDCMKVSQARLLQCCSGAAVCGVRHCTAGVLLPTPTPAALRGGLQGF